MTFGQNKFALRCCGKTAIFVDALPAQVRGYRQPLPCQADKSRELIEILQLLGLDFPIALSVEQGKVRIKARQQRSLAAPETKYLRWIFRQHLGHKQRRGLMLMDCQIPEALQRRLHAGKTTPGTKGPP